MKLHLQRHQNNHSHKDCEERATEDTLTLSRGTVALGSGLSALAEASAGSRSGAGAAAGAARVRAGSAVAGHTTGTTVVGGDAVAAGGGGTAAVGTEGHVQTGSTEGTENGRVISDGDVGLHGSLGGVDVRVVAGLLGARGGSVASDIDLANSSVVVTLLLDVLAVPVNLTTGPVDGTLGVAGLAGGPERHLQARGGLGVLEAVGSGVPGVGLLQGAHDGAVDDPLGLVGLPVDLVGVPVVKGILVADRGVGAVVPVENTLPVVVGLNRSQVGTNPLVIDLVLDVGEQDESSDDTLAAGRLDLAADLAVPDVVVVGEESTDGVLGHGHEQVAILGLGEAAVGPVGGGGIAQVLGVQDGVVEVIPGVALVLTDGHRGARADGEGGLGVATTETVCAGTTLAILCNATRDRLAIDSVAWVNRRPHEGKLGFNIREQQGLSSGHWLLVLQVVVVAARAVAERAERARSGVTKRTIV